MKVAVFGGTGFVGKYILKSLRKHDHEIYTLVRNGSESKIDEIENINIINGEISNNTSLDQTMMNCSYNIIKMYPRHILTPMAEGTTESQPKSR